MARRVKKRWILLGLAAASVAGALLWLRDGIEPTPSGPMSYVRYEQSTRLNRIIDQLYRRGVVKNTKAFRLYTWLTRHDSAINPGTYRIHPGMTAKELMASLQRPVQQLVRIPEGWWIARVAQRLEAAQVCSAEEYVRLANDPEQFAKHTKLDLSKVDSLEGYLFPDTYDLPPLIGAFETIRKQLKAFETKVLPRLPKHTDLARTIKIASLVELEVASDAERPVVAGIVENRLKKDMPLQIDATVLYALQDWRVLKPGEVKRVDSPYNTYLHNGLPPGPIGSPGLKSILAATAPTSSEYLYYVALPNRTHMFSTTYEGHIQNIRRRKKALSALQGGS